MNDEVNNLQAEAPKDAQTKSPAQSAPETSKRSIRIKGLKIAGGVEGGTGGRDVVGYVDKSNEINKQMEHL